MIAALLLDSDVLRFQLLEVLEALDDDLQLNTSFLSSLLGVVKVFNVLPVLEVLGRGEDVWNLLALLEQVFNRHQDLACLSDSLALQLSVFVPLSEEDALLLVDVLKNFLLLRHIIVNQSLFHLHLVFKLTELPADLFMLVCVLLLLLLQLIVLGNELLVSGEDIDCLSEFVRVGIFNRFEEPFVLFHCFYFFFDFLGLRFVVCQQPDLLPDFIIELFNFLPT